MSKCDILIWTENLQKIKFIKEHINLEKVNISHICVQEPRECSAVQLIEHLNDDRLILSKEVSINDIIMILRSFLNNLSQSVEIWSEAGIEEDVNRLCDIIDDYQQGIKLERLKVEHFLNVIIERLVGFYNIEDISTCKMVLPEQVAEIVVDYRIIDIWVENGYKNDLLLKDFYRYYWGISPERYWIFCNNVRVQNYTGLLLGMSYVQRGINLRRLKYNTICMAAPSQDIFFDNRMLSYILNTENSADLQFCIQEMTPYELWYDMSISKQTEHRSMYYYPQVQSMHHYAGQEKAVELFVQYKKIYDEIMEKDLVYDEFSIWRQTNHAYEEEDVAIWKMTAEDDKARVEIEKIFDKPYENTFNENVAILEEMFATLVGRNIVPIILLPPFPQIFLENMNEEMVLKTLNVLGNLKEKYPEIVILNYMDDDDFDDYYFADWSHLNYWGSNLLSEKLNVELDRILNE